MSIASLFIMVRIPPQNDNAIPWGIVYDIMNPWTLVIFMTFYKVEITISGELSSTLDLHVYASQPHHPFSYREPVDTALSLFLADHNPGQHPSLVFREL